jgi:seryl-tRNA synthetase
LFVCEKHYKSPKWALFICARSGVFEVLDMIDMNELRAHADRYIEAARVKRIPCDIPRVLELDAQRRELQTQVDALRQKRNELARGAAAAAGLPDNERARAKALGDTLAGLERELADVVRDFDRAVLFIPSLPAADVPIGATDDDNVEIRRIGLPPQFDFAARDHIELARMHGWIDFDAPREFAGSRAYALTGDLVLLEMALMRFAMDFLMTRGFTPVAPPLMVRENAMTGTGYFPVGEENAYALERDGLWLVGTSEVPLAAMQMSKTLDLAALPLRVAGISACFRREAGAAGRDTRGLYRVHQFQKVEQVVFCENDETIARAMHDQLLANSEALLAALELPYRVVAVCTGELGLGQIRKHDIETWMPSRAAYGETHSCSTLGDFQTRRLNVRYKDATGKKRFAFTLNNTAIATPRILIPLLENHQRADGTVHVPPALRPYLANREFLG